MSIYDQEERIRMLEKKVELLLESLEWKYKQENDDFSEKMREIDKLIY